ncbi:MAG: DUF559 domain-containing protein [Terricaulis sp.]
MRAHCRGKSLQRLTPQRRGPHLLSQSLGAPDSSSIEEERGAWAKRRAKHLRSELTPAEKALWRIVHAGELTALNWRRQTPFDRYILDIVSHPARLVVEVDGIHHGEPEHAEHDARRTAVLESQGYRVLRVWNHDALHNQDGVWLAIHAAARETPAAARMQRWQSAHEASLHAKNASISDQAPTSSSMEEVVSPPRGETGGGVRSRAKKTPPRAPLAIIEEEH